LTQAWLATTAGSPGIQSANPYWELGTDSIRLFLTYRACELVTALPAFGVLPYWMPLVWLAMNLSSAIFREKHVNTAHFRALPERARLWHFRATAWLRMAIFGGAAYFLYVPGDYKRIIFLAIALVTVVGIAALRLASDASRAIVAIGFVLVPMSVRLMFSGDPILESLGLGLVLFWLVASFELRVYARNLALQADQRGRAEHTADAIASTLLSKARFFDAVSHDLRQPLHAIGLYLDPVRKLVQSSGDLTAMRAIDGIQQSWIALDALVSQILDLTRADSGVLVADMCPVALAPMVRSLVLQHSAAAENADLRIVAMVRPDACVVADEMMLRRIVSNLVDNAIKFSRPSTTVLIVVRRAQGAWRLQVRDSGVGVAPLDQTSVFNEFVQLNNNARNRNQGLGLGLAIAQRFARLMQGSLSMRSDLEKGTCMTLRLASINTRADNEKSIGSTHPPPASLAYPHNSYERPPSSAKHPVPGLGAVLLVEDDLRVAAAMRSLLQSWGLQVTVTHSAAEGRTNAHRARVAICDIRLPDLDENGLSLAIELRARGMKVLLVTGETDKSVRETARRHGLQVLTKPVLPNVLHSALLELAGSCAMR